MFNPHAVENNANDALRLLARVRDINAQIQKKLCDVTDYCDLLISIPLSDNRRAHATAQMQKILTEVQELDGEKFIVLDQVEKLVEKKTRQLEADIITLRIKLEKLQNHEQLKDT